MQNAPRHEGRPQGAACDALGEAYICSGNRTLRPSHDGQTRRAGKTTRRAGDHPAGSDESRAGLAAARAATGRTNLGGWDSANLCRPDRTSRLGASHPDDRNPCRTHSAHRGRRGAALDTDPCAGCRRRRHIPPASAITGPAGASPPKRSGNTVYVSLTLIPLSIG